MNLRVGIIALVAVVLALAIGWKVTQSDSDTSVVSAPVVTESSAEVTQPVSQPVPDQLLGNPMAKVKVIEYGSFTCSHCAAFHNSAFKPLREKYIDTGKISFVFREVYFDQFGLLASMIGRCSGNTQDFYAFVDSLFSQQREWMASRDGNKMLNELVSMGKSVGMTDQQIDVCLEDEAKATSLMNWYQQNAKQDNIRSTPSFVVDGELMSNMSFEEFSKILDKKLAL